MGEMYEPETDYSKGYVNGILDSMKIIHKLLII